MVRNPEENSVVTLQDAIYLPSCLQVLTSVNVHQRKENPETFIGLDSGTELSLS